mgnify:CR=1 FL=1
MLKITKKIRISTYVASFLVGSCIAVFPLISNTAKDPKNVDVINYEKEVSKITNEQIVALSPFKALQDLPSTTEMDMPTPPSVPDMPGSGAGINNVVGGQELKVVGVLPPDIVILQKGGKTITAAANNNCEFGYVGSISADGAYIDGAFMKIKF